MEDWGDVAQGGFDLLGNLGQSAFRWMGERDRARFARDEARAWADAYSTAAPAIAQAQADALVFQSQGRDKLLLAGFAILAVVVLFRVRPTANG